MSEYTYMDAREIAITVATPAASLSQPNHRLIKLPTNRIHGPTVVKDTEMPGHIDPRMNPVFT